MGAPALVGAVGVVDVELALEVAPEAGGLGGRVARESRLPALLEECPRDAFDAAVGGRRSGSEVEVRDIEGGEDRIALLASEPGGVVGGNGLQTPAAAGELFGHPPSQGRGPVREGFLGVRWGSAQASEEATSMAGSCQTRPWVPLRRPRQKRSI